MPKERKTPEQIRRAGLAVEDASLTRRELSGNTTPDAEAELARAAREELFARLLLASARRDQMADMARVQAREQAFAGQQAPPAPRPAPPPGVPGSQPRTAPLPSPPASATPTPALNRLVQMVPGDAPVQTQLRQTVPGDAPTRVPVSPAPRPELEGTTRGIPNALVRYLMTVER